ncbi:serine protein kinase RIO [Candidatus Woesearchaeota archaeon]|nr:serine protein kinase RIO [Candidatus Woesearchaeota archaeon]
MPKKSKEKWKIWGNVFDEYTINTIKKLMTQNVIDGIESPVKIGKEANIFTAKTKTGDMRIVKIYRLESCNFNKMYDYIRYDPRFLNIKKQRRQIIFTWVQREYRNLIKARAAGVRVPTPLANINNVLVLEFIGDDTIAPQLKDSMPESKTGKEKMQNAITCELRKLYTKAGLVHADLSEFNILNYRGNPVLIDFSQTTPVENMNSDDYLKRDIGNLIRFFHKHGLDLLPEELYQKITKQ